MGPLKTPLQHDHEKLVRVEGYGTLPCSYFTREGVRVENFEGLMKVRG